MTRFQNAMEVFKLLDKSNCRKCQEATCLAFAAAVFQGKREIEECPQLDSTVVEQFGGEKNTGDTVEQDMETAVAGLQKKIEDVNLSGVADKLGGVFADNKLTLKILGKDVSVDLNGNFYTDIHVHGWIAGPVLNYILYGEGRDVSGKWVSMRELEGGKTWHRFFDQRCLKPVKRIADIYTDLFDDLIHLFAGSQIELEIAGTPGNFNHCVDRGGG